MSERLFQLFTRDAQPRVHRVHGNSEHLGDLRCGHFLDFVKYQDGAFADFDGREGVVETRQVLATGHGVRLGGFYAGARHGIASVGDLRMAAPVAASVACHPEDDLEQPCARPVPPIFELVPPPVGDDEHLLRSVLRVALGNTQASEVSPYEVYVLLVHASEPSRPVRGGRHVNEEGIERRARAGRFCDDAGLHVS
ncbi:MAG TPA: hypothetical protein VKU41_28055 [Polyangiaceae bacterium]|nr:hypothetical protein [Polyangiaceae bacterium]